MARRRRYAERQPPSFFPFLSVLLCVLGVLMFLAAGLAAGSLSKALSTIRIEFESGANHERVPVLLECTKDRAATILDSRFTITSAELSREETAARYAQFLEQFTDSGKPDSNEYLMFVVRPDGIAMYEMLHQLLTARNQRRCVIRFQIAAAETLVGSLSGQAQTRFQAHGDTLVVLGRLSAADREAIRKLPVGAAVADELYNKSQQVTPCIDSGLELVPAGWKFARDTRGGTRLVRPEESRR